MRAGGRGAPDGWYLTGVVVDPTVRRGGVGLRLTEARLEALRVRGTETVWYFATARNTVSLDLHRRLGFRDVTREFSISGVSFDGGEGVLSRWDATHAPDMRT
ncbi:N-acetyltransferase [Tessaracoccus sp. ZS01]|uniref:GNAT family N-acetyltransferase n=1 Tax=Tessaracoccus sp. ZS01 TaxID=1906324 RepID=UPI001E381058|nr:GNAT family N-acetyltransferase [Tessaracoccus sp. ZS01]